MSSGSLSSIGCCFTHCQHSVIESIALITSVSFILKRLKKKNITFLTRLKLHSIEFQLLQAPGYLKEKFNATLNI